MDIGEIIGEVAPCVSIPTKSAIYVWGYNQSGQTRRKGQEKHLRIPKQLRPELFGCPAGANSRWNIHIQPRLHQMDPSAFVLRNEKVCRTSEEASSRRWSLSCFNRCILVEGAV
ncbi:unnamed protein product [Microthlaspi erraticum]|uniref:Uncharacterized protein n=1 Tax=Microthlaspi erraticum TaxID=1685480 RepID=A0A6D2JFP3_9BRAS|nr:unnamed protein product [Microthlaspi erraticum]